MSTWPVVLNLFFLSTPLPIGSILNIHVLYTYFNYNIKKLKTPINLALSRVFMITSNYLLNLLNTVGKYVLKYANNKGDNVFNNTGIIKILHYRATRERESLLVRIIREGLRGIITPGQGIRKEIWFDQNKSPKINKNTPGKGNDMNASMQPKCIFKVGYVVYTGYIAGFFF